jgi:hypothetical protein
MKSFLCSMYGIYFDYFHFVNLTLCFKTLWYTYKVYKMCFFSTLLYTRSNVQLLVHINLFSFLTFLFSFKTQKNDP